jgi:hypothetical protein
MHPLLQPTRTQRIVNRAIDTAGAAFAVFVFTMLAAAVVLAAYGLAT